MGTAADTVAASRRTELSPYALPAHLASLSWRAGPALAALVGGVVVWELASRTVDLPFMPPVGAIANAFWRMLRSGEIFESVRDSMTVLLLGFGLAVVAGVPVGLVTGRYRRAGNAIDPYLDALLSVPSLLLVPIFFGLFGLGRGTHVAVVFVYTFVVIAVMTRSGLATLDPALVEMARSFGASESQILRRVLLPGALPSVIAGLQLGVGRAIRGLINVEMLLGSAGLGALLRRYGARFDAASVYGVLIVLVALALAGSQLLHMAYRRLDPSAP
jgi:ABC-type nitrate/sulfonate/bicarbonate transport system permease component